MIRFVVVLLTLASLSASAEKKVRAQPLSKKSELLYDWSLEGGAFGCQLSNGRYFSLTVEGETATISVHAYEWSVDTKDWIPFNDQTKIAYDKVYVEEIQSGGVPNLRIFSEASGLNGAQTLDLRVPRQGAGTILYRREFMQIPRDPTSMNVWSLSETGAHEALAIHACQFSSAKFNSWMQGNAF